MKDNELIREYAQGSQDALEQLIDRHTAMVYSVCNRVLNDRHLAEDATQATFILLSRQAAKLSSNVLLAGWLHLTAQNIARVLRKSEQRRILRERKVMVTPNHTSPQLDLEDLRPKLDSAIAGLPAPQRDAILLCYFQGMTQAQAAAELNCPPKTLGSRIALGMAALRNKLGGAGAAISSSAFSVLLLQHAIEPAPPTLGASIKAVCIGGVAPSNLITSVLREQKLNALRASVLPWTAAAIAVVTICGAAAWLRPPAAGERTPLATPVPVQSLLRQPALPPALPSSPLTNCAVVWYSGVQCIQISPDSRHVAIGSFQNIKYNDIDSNAEFTNLGAHKDTVYALAFSPDGTLLASGSGDHSVMLWYPGARNPPGVFDGHTGPVYAVCFSPDGRTLASAGKDGAIKIWDVVHPALKSTLSTPNGAIFSLKFLNNSAVVSGAFDGSVRLWDLVNPQNSKVLSRHAGPVTALDYSVTAGLLASAGWDNTVIIYDSTSLRERTRFTLENAGLTCMAFRPGDADIAIGGIDTKLSVWSKAQKQVVPIASSPWHSLICLAWSSDTKHLLIGSTEKRVTQHPLGLLSK